MSKFVLSLPSLIGYTRSLQIKNGDSRAAMRYVSALSKPLLTTKSGVNVRIEIKPETLERLKKFDKNITDADVNNFLDTFGGQRVAKTAGIQKLKDDDKLLGAKVLEVLIGGDRMPITRKSWNYITDYMIGLAGMRKYTHTQIRNMFAPLNIFAGKSNERGWQYVKLANISVQRAATDRIVTAIKKARTKLKVDVYVECRLKNGEERYF